MVFLIDIQLGEDAARFTASSVSDILSLLKKEGMDFKLEFLRVERLQQVDEAQPKETSFGVPSDG